MHFSPFKELIKGRCGLTFDEARTATLEDAIRQRMSRRGLTSAGAYLDCLSGDNDEFNSLVDLVTVNETYFYREPAHLRLLTDRIIPGLLATKKRGQKIRIMSAGCSTGEEPYSIVIALAEAHGDNAKALFTVIGADIDSGALKKAGLACYTRHSLRQFPEELKKKYFDQAGPNVSRLKDSVRVRAGFIPLNLMSPAYPNSLKDLDVIFYRNVSIYFEPDVQKAIFLKLSDLLNEDGYLIVSATETLSHNIGVMSLVEIDGQFIYRKKVNIDIGDRRRGPKAPTAAIPSGRDARGPFSAGNPGPIGRAGQQAEVICLAPAAKPVPVPGGSVAQPPAERGPERREPRLLFNEALALARAKEFHASVERLDALIAMEPSFAGAYTLKASVLINLKDLETAERMCLAAIEADRWCLEAFLLLGMIAKIRGDEEAAMKWFKVALYIRSSCWLAHYYVADVCRLRGETEHACREYEIVVKLLGKGGIEDGGLTYFPLSFSIEQIVHLCNHNLLELRKKPG